MKAVKIIKTKKLLIMVLTILAVTLSAFFSHICFGAPASQVSDVQLLARAINGEARGEPYEGQVAVGAVILNRVKSPNFPTSLQE